MLLRNMKKLLFPSLPDLGFLGFFPAEFLSPSLVKCLSAPFPVPILTPPDLAQLINMKESALREG